MEYLLVVTREKGQQFNCFCSHSIHNLISVVIIFFDDLPCSFNCYIFLISTHLYTPIFTLQSRHDLFHSYIYLDDHVSSCFPALLIHFYLQFNNHLNTETTCKESLFIFQQRSITHILSQVIQITVQLLSSHLLFLQYLQSQLLTITISSLLNNDKSFYLFSFFVWFDNNFVCV